MSKVKLFARTFIFNKSLVFSVVLGQELRKGAKLKKTCYIWEVGGWVWQTFFDIIPIPSTHPLIAPWCYICLKNCPLSDGTNERIIFGQYPPSKVCSSIPQLYSSPTLFYICVLHCTLKKSLVFFNYMNMTRAGFLTILMLIWTPWESGWFERFLPNLTPLSTSSSFYSACAIGYFAMFTAQGSPPLSFQMVFTNCKINFTHICPFVLKLYNPSAMCKVTSKNGLPSLYRSFCTMWSGSA